MSARSPEPSGRLATSTRGRDLWLTVAGCELHVEVRPGSGSTTPLLLCSGLGAGLEVFDPLVDALDELDAGIPVVRVDMPGVGRSPASRAPLGMPQLAALLAGVLDRLDLERVDVLGHSWGGALAQQFAVQHPDRYRRLVLVATSTGAWSVPGRFWDLAPLLFRGTAPDATRRTQASSPAGRLRQMAAVAMWTSLPLLPLIRRPVLVIGGADDRVVPPVNARILAALLSRATLCLLPGGHLEIVSAPQPIARAVTAFLLLRTEAT